MPEATNGNHQNIILKLGSQVVHALPAQFLALLLINAAFLGVLFVYIDRRAAHSVEIINQLLQSCLKGHQ
jgi:hypothetical protein